MLDLSEIVKQPIPNYPKCPVEQICSKVFTYRPEELEKIIMDFLMEIEKHEDELRVFRKNFEKKLLEYQIETIIKERESESGNN